MSKKLMQANDHRASAYQSIEVAEELLRDMKGRKYRSEDATVKLLNIQTCLLDALVQLALARDKEGR